MEHSEIQIRPWRTATIVTAGIATVELVLLVVAGIVLLGKSIAPDVKAAAGEKARSAHRAPAPAVPVQKPHLPAPAVAKLPRGATGVTVLNGNGQSGAAAGTAQIVRARGYQVREVGNAPRASYPRSIVMYRAGFRGEALRFARDLDVRVVTPLDGKAGTRPGPQLTLIVGRD